jgi:hypothetical protein
MIDTMKTITLEQPWATLVALGMKTVITRPDPTVYVGPLTIYAAKTARLNDDPYIRSVLASAGYSVETLPLETPVARATLVNCQKITRATIPCYPEYAFSEFKEGWFAWRLADIECMAH